MTVVFIDPIFLSNSAGFVTVFKNPGIHPMVLLPSAFLIRCTAAIAVNNSRPTLSVIFHLRDLRGLRPRTPGECYFIIVIFPALRAGDTIWPAVSNYLERNIQIRGDNLIS